MKEIKLTTQLNLIFTVVTLLTSLVFIVALNRVFDDFRNEQNIEQLESYFEEVRENPNFPPDSEYNGYVIAQNNIIINSNNIELLDGNYTASQLVNVISVWPGFTKEETLDEETYY
ncbi:MAG: hypothetical protein KKG64_02435, partial [Firmicutes bacterium]|nr:hypothetical protein [Bacillota bacterium]